MSAIRSLKPRGWLALAVALALASPASAAGETEPRRIVAFLPTKLLDTSAEPTDQSGDHARRLAAMDGLIAADLARGAVFSTVSVSAETLKTRCPTEAPQCLLDLARIAGADLVFIGVVHKSSTLIMQLWARLVDARTGRDVFSRDLNFRGDNDEAWQRAEAFLVGQIKDAELPR